MRTDNQERPLATVDLKDYEHARAAGVNLAKILIKRTWFQVPRVKLSERGIVGAVIWTG